LRHNGGGNGDLNRAIVRALLRSRFDERGRLFVITSRRTFSAAQMLICDLEKWTFPISVGEPPASRSNHYGDSASSPSQIGTSIGHRNTGAGVRLSMSMTAPIDCGHSSAC
jgi:hypothetical protein